MLTNVLYYVRYYVGKTEIPLEVGLSIFISMAKKIKLSCSQELVSEFPFKPVSYSYIFLYRSVMGSVTVSGWSSPESISEDLAEPGTRRYDLGAGLGGRT